MVDIKEVLEKHRHWLHADCEGWQNMRANLSGANLYGADLFRANLSGAHLSGADLSGADLSGANLSGADLSKAHLSGADLSGANLSGADLSKAHLSGANLSGANLSGADLSGANLSGANIDKEILSKLYPICCPEYGSFIGWKKAHGYIVKLEIQENAKRSSACDRKCRCSSAKVLAIEYPNGTPSGLHKIESNYDPDFVYEVGETVTVYNFDEDRWNQCSTGIHFFITRKEAEDYC